MPDEKLENFEEDFGGLKPGDMSRLNFPWHKKLVLKFFPQLFFKLFAKNINLNNKKIDFATKLFGDANRIDIQPLSGSSRGFIIYIDNKLSLWFYQDGDHFIYDGFEMGEYENGDVTIFDGIKSNE